MGRKKSNFCDVTLNGLEDSLRKLFSTEYIINCFDITNRLYTEILNNENIVSLFASQELIETINILFDNSINLSLASRKGFMHRNTLIYRVNKILKLTGLNIKFFEDAVILKNLILIYNLLKNEE